MSSIGKGLARGWMCWVRLSRLFVGRGVRGVVRSSCQVASVRVASDASRVVA